MTTALLTYTTPTEVISANAQVQLLALVEVLRAAIPDITTTSPSGASPASPQWDEFTPRMSAQLRAELAALKTAIDAAPTA